MNLNFPKAENSFLRRLIYQPCNAHWLCWHNK